MKDGSTGSSLLTLEAGMANSFVEVVRRSRCVFIRYLNKTNQAVTD